MDDAAVIAFPSDCEIPVDYMIKGHLLGLTGGDLTVHDAAGAVAFRVRGRSRSAPHRGGKVLLDASDAPIVSIAPHEDGWQGFRGNSWEKKDLLFTVKKILYSSFKTELEVLLPGENSEDPTSSFRLKGSPFQRSCTIYRGDSIVAQANPLYKLNKVIYSRRNFRLTIFPGHDHPLILAMLLIFLGSSRLLDTKA